MRPTCFGSTRTCPRSRLTSETIPGGLLSVIEALADETRLQILAFFRDRGEGCILKAERREGVKWYRINGGRVNAVAENVKAFLREPHQ